MTAASIRAWKVNSGAGSSDIQIIGPGDYINRSEARVFLEVGVPESPGFHIVSAAF